MDIAEQYVDYLNKHVSNVARGFEWIQEHLPDVIEDRYGTIECIYNHDSSKWDDEEFLPYAEYFYEDKLQFTEKALKELDTAFDVAWNHHQKCNPHHWQYWVLMKDSGDEIYLDIPSCYLIEMICDWWAFSWAENNLYEIFKWYDTNKETIKLSDNTRKKLENILSKIEEKLKELE